MSKTMKLWSPCEHCGALRVQHPKDKCLYGSTQYKGTAREYDVPEGGYADALEKPPSSERLHRNQGNGGEWARDPEQVIPDGAWSCDYERPRGWDEPASEPDDGWLPEPKPKW